MGWLHGMILAPGRFLWAHPFPSLGLWGNPAELRIVAEQWLLRYGKLNDVKMSVTPCEYQGWFTA